MSRRPEVPHGASGTAEPHAGAFMGRGQEFLHRVHDVLDEFEQAVRQDRRVFGRSVARRQQVDDARRKVVETIVQIVKEAQEAYSEKR